MKKLRLNGVHPDQVQKLEVMEKLSRHSGHRQNSGIVFSKVHSHIFRHPVKGYPHHGTIHVQEELLRVSCTGQLVAEEGDGRKKRNTKSEISKEFVDQIQNQQTHENNIQSDATNFRQSQN